MKIPIIIVFALMTFFACQTEQDQTASLENKWLGSHSDQNYVLPLNVLLDFRKDGNVTLNYFNDTSRTVSWIRSFQNIKIDTTTFAIENLSADKLVLSSSIDSSTSTYFEYRKITPANQQLSVKGIKAKLQSVIWTDTPSLLKRGLKLQQLFKFTDEQLWLKRLYFYNGELIDIKEYEIFCYTIDSYEDYFFINYQNGVDSCNNVLPTEQIIVANDRKFETINFNHKSANYWNLPSKQHKILQPYDGSIAIDNQSSVNDSLIFRPCSDYLSLESYQSNLVFHQNGQYAMNDFFLSQYQLVDDVSSGIVSIRFMVNCNGQIGRFHLYQVDEQFRKTQFDLALIRQVLELTAQLNAWQAAIQTRTQRRDSYKHLKFRFKNGKLLEVFNAND